MKVFRLISLVVMALVVLVLAATSAVAATSMVTITMNFDSTHVAGTFTVTGGLCPTGMFAAQHLPGNSSVFPVNTVYTLTCDDASGSFDIVGRGSFNAS